MQRILSIFFLLVVSSVITSCNKTNNSSSNTTTTTTVSQDKTFISSISNNTSECIRQARDGNMSQSIVQFLNLSNGVSGNDTWANNMTDALKTSMGGSIELDPNNYNKFNFNNYKGIYTWNSSNNTFSKQNSSTGIYINIPSSPNEPTNNTTIQFTDYSDDLFPVNADFVYLPLTAKGSIKKNNTLIADMNFVANYSTINFPTPITLDYSIYLAPHNYTFKVEKINNTQFRFTSNLLSGGGCGMTLNANISFNNDDYNNFVLEDDLNSIQAEYKTGDLTITSNFDALSYFSFNNPTTTNLNNNLSNMVYYKTEKIADLKFVDLSGNRKLFIYYKDGTSEDTIVYYDPFLSNIKNILRSIFGNDVDTWF